MINVKILDISFSDIIKNDDRITILSFALNEIFDVCLELFNKNNENILGFFYM